MNSVLRIQAISTGNLRSPAFSSRSTPEDCLVDSQLESNHLLLPWLDTNELRRLFPCPRSLRNQTIKSTLRELTPVSILLLILITRHWDIP